MFDVAVIGGNLAGANAAIAAARKGVRVALVERNPEPIFPPRCGEVMPGMWAHLLKLDEIGCPKNHFRRMVVNVSSSREYVLALKGNQTIVFDRHFAEKHLLDEAHAAGVEMFLGRRMTDFRPPHDVVLNHDTILRSKVVIDASGISCQVGKRVGMPARLRKENVGVCMQSRVHGDFDPEAMNIWFHKPYAPFLYAYLFPLSDHEANIGVATFGGKTADLPRLHRKYIEDRTGGKCDILHTFRACVPLAPPMDRLVKDNVMVTGDAGRLVNAEWGCGIRNALVSGRAAGETAAEFVQGKIASLEPYQASMEGRISALKRALKLRRKFADERRFIGTLRRRYWVQSALSKIIPACIQDPITKAIVRKMG